MDLDVWHASPAGTLPGGCSGWAQAGRRLLARASATGGRAAPSMGAHRELGWVAREGEGEDARTPQGSSGRVFGQPGAGQFLRVEGGGAWKGGAPMVTRVCFCGY